LNPYWKQVRRRGLETVYKETKKGKLILNPETYEYHEWRGILQQKSDIPRMPGGLKHGECLMGRGKKSTTDNFHRGPWTDV